MSIQGQCFLSIDDLDAENITLLFSRTQLFKREFAQHRSINHLLVGDKARAEIMGLLFFEPSTRTRMSFEMAGKRLGIQSIKLDSQSSSSLAKGESLVQTLETVAQMSPDILVIRHSGDPEVESRLRHLEMPVINAGSGTRSHPTQALLDAFSIEERLGSVKGRKVVIVGDVFHSRVANSNLRLLTKMGAEVAICGPEKLLPTTGHWEKVTQFTNFNEALDWCDACMCLRMQQERHGQKDLGLTLNEYRSRYLMDKNRLEILGAEGLVLHPGPVVRGVEMSGEVIDDSRSLIGEQVRNGVFIRAALISMVLGMKV